MSKELTLDSINIIVEEQSSAKLDEGIYEATVTSVELVSSKLGTPQLEVKFKAAGKTVTNWFNLVGYKKDADGEFILDKRGKRAIDPENTEKALRILKGFAFNLGFEEGEKVTPSSFIDKEVGIEVYHNEEGYARVKRTMLIDDVEATEALSF